MFKYTKDDNIKVNKAEDRIEYIENVLDIKLSDDKKKILQFERNSVDCLFEQLVQLNDRVNLLYSLVNVMFAMNKLSKDEIKEARRRVEIPKLEKQVKSITNRIEKLKEIKASQVILEKEYELLVQKQALLSKLIEASKKFTGDLPFSDKIFKLNKIDDRFWFKHGLS